MRHWITDTGVDVRSGGGDGLAHASPAGDEGVDPVQLLRGEWRWVG